jgi:hypothetical protein
MKGIAKEVRTERRGDGMLKLLARCVVLLAGLGSAGALSGCLVAGYSSRGGGFIWPGGLGGLVLLALLFFFLRGRR